jgi:hypothetical protein
LDTNGANATSTITHVEQTTVNDAVSSGLIDKTTPEQMNALLGLISFTADAAYEGAFAHFSLFVNQSTGVNGYWKLDANDTWVNLASEIYGGSIAVVGDKLRLDFQIQDGGEFDDDHTINGVITDPGALATMALSLTSYRPDLPSGEFWF